VCVCVYVCVCVCVCVCKQFKGFASGQGAVGVALVVGAAIQVSVVYLTCT